MFSRLRAAALSLMAAAMVVAAGSTAVAQSTATGNLSVQANVTKNCVVSSSSINFGDYDPTNAAALDGAGSVILRCTKGTATRIDLGSVGARQMNSVTTGDNLAYELYSDSARTTVWGTGAGSGFGWSAANSANASLPVYGRVAPGQNVGAANNYVQTITVTVVY